MNDAQINEWTENELSMLKEFCLKNPVICETNERGKSKTQKLLLELSHKLMGRYTGTNNIVVIVVHEQLINTFN